MSDVREQECGAVYEHDTVETYNGPDGVQWMCRRCGAEGYEETE